MNTQKLEQVPIDKLVPYARNARTHSKEQIAQLRASLREFGFVSPAVIDADYNILVGHGRITAAREEGYETVPCVFAENLTEAQKRAYILADNQLALNAGWDEEMLSVELSDLQDQSFDLSLLGFDAGELDKLLGTGNEKDIADDDFDLTAALEKASFVEPGDIWTVGRHRVMCGDATSPEDVEKLMNGKKANLVLTDPPYNVDVEETAGKIMNDNMSDSDFYNFLLAAYKCMYDSLADDGSIYVWHADTEGLNFRRAFREAGFHISGVCIWAKNSLVLGRSPYQWQHEPVLFGWLPNGKHRWFADRKQTTIWNFDKPKHSAQHPTMKPIPLLAYPIKNSSAPNGIVLDLFGGSGSTLIACEQTDRICRTMELDPKYATVIVQRYVDLVGGTADVHVLRNGIEISFEEATARE